MDLPGNADLLIGCNNDGYAWGQMEAHKVTFEEGVLRGAILFVRHMLDYLQYVWTGKNVGPCGLSEYTEVPPLILRKEQLQLFFRGMKARACELAATAENECRPTPEKFYNLYSSQVIATSAANKSSVQKSMVFSASPAASDNRPAAAGEESNQITKEKKLSWIEKARGEKSLLSVAPNR